jgi:hypothetical protein
MGQNLAIDHRIYSVGGDGHLAGAEDIDVPTMKKRFWKRGVGRRMVRLNCGPPGASLCGWNKANHC